MPFAKFISLLAYRALWFSKLNILQDEYEGRIPAVVRSQMHEHNQRYKETFSTPEFQRQIDAWPTKNEEDGRELLVLTCWFAGESESQRMWEEYGGSNEAVAVKSTVDRLASYIFVPSDETASHLGMVSYVDHASLEMSISEANQAMERAFLKGANFCHEQEIRLVTMNVKTTSCASPDGIPYTEEQVSGALMNNFENAGLYIGVDLDRLIKEIVVCPTADEWFERLIRRIVHLSV